MDMTLQEVLDGLKGGQAEYRWPVRLFNNLDGKLLKNSDALLKSDYLGRFRAINISFNEMLLCYDIRIEAMPEVKDVDSDK